MCILFFYFDGAGVFAVHNRDEFDRPTKSLEEWTDTDIGIIAGKDLKHGGTWMGYNKNNYTLCMLTNIKGTTINNPDVSRGKIVINILQASNCCEYITSNFINDKTNNVTNNAQNIKIDNTILEHKENITYGGFNVIFGNIKLKKFYFFNSIEKKMVKLEPKKLYGLSNDSLNTSEYAITFGKERFNEIITKKGVKSITLSDVLSIMGHKKIFNNIGNIWKTRTTTIFHKIGNVIDIKEHNWKNNNTTNIEISHCFNLNITYATTNSIYANTNSTCCLS